MADIVALSAYRAARGGDRRDRPAGLLRKRTVATLLLFTGVRRETLEGGGDRTAHRAGRTRSPGGGER